MKKKFLAILLCLVLLLCACGAPGAEETGGTDQHGETTGADTNTGVVPEETFWIVTEDTVSGDMSYQLRNAVRYIQDKHPELEVRIDYLEENDSQETEIFLQQLRTDIIAGRGPDVFILSTAHVYGALFNNVTQTMRNGHFLDIGKYYDADTELDKDGLNGTIMDAGIWEGTRYVLPLRYDMAVYMADAERVDETGKDLNWFESTNLQEKMDTALTEQNQRLMQSIFPTRHIDKFLLAFPDCIDYKSENVLLEQEELEAFWRSFTAILSATDTSFMDLVGLGDRPTTQYVESGLHLGSNAWPVLQTNLFSVVGNVLVCKTAEVSYEMLPVRDVDGEITASVSWWGALGSSCNDPEIGYEFLRLFLTEEYQWELKRPKDAQPGMIGNSWPVRDKGAAEYVYRRYQADPDRYSDEESPLYDPDMAERADILASTQVTDSDFPFLDFRIDNVYFPISLEYDVYISYMTDYLFGRSATPPDPEEMTTDILRRLTIQVAEG